MGGNSPEEVKSHIRFYWMIYVALLVLTVVTVGVSYLTVGVGMAIFIAMVVASVKGTLVSAYFMHLSNEKKLIYFTLILTVFFLLVCLLIPPLFHLNSQMGTEFYVTE